LQVKEDGHTLYGFHESREKDMFLHLISVSGVGASTARMMLSSLKPEELSRAILQGDVRQLERVKGIGKKTAERLVLELKDKMSKHESGATGVRIPSGNKIEQDALDALTALGISRGQAEQSIRKVIREQDGSMPLETLIKKANIKNIVNFQVIRSTEFRDDKQPVKAKLIKGIKKPDKELLDDIKDYCETLASHYNKEKCDIKFNKYTTSSKLTYRNILDFIRQFCHGPELNKNYLPK